MLNAREPKIINGPQVLDKYVGESEANIRKLFAEAEEEEKRVGEAMARLREDQQLKTWKHSQNVQSLQSELGSKLKNAKSELHIEITC